MDKRPRRACAKAEEAVIEALRRDHHQIDAAVPGLPDDVDGILPAADGWADRCADVPRSPAAPPQLVVLMFAVSRDRGAHDSSSTTTPTSRNISAQSARPPMM